MAGAEPVDRESLGEPFGNRLRLARPRRGAGAGDDRVLPKQDRHILDEDAVGMLGQSGQARDRKARLDQRVFISRMLADRAQGVDRRIERLRRLALGEARADGARESGGHGRPLAKKKAARKCSGPPRFSLDRVSP